MENDWVSAVSRRGERSKQATEVGGWNVGKYKFQENMKSRCQSLTDWVCSFGVVTFGRCDKVSGLVD